MTRAWPAVTNDNVGNGSPHLSNYAQRYYTGPSGEILDAFVFYSTEVGEESMLSVKAGQHNVFWGETILNPVHSISYGQSGLDLAKLAASPGTEAKELFVPRNQLSMSFTVNPELTVGAQYFLDWDAARLPEAGTYYGGSDLVGFGAQSFLLGNTNAVVPGSPLGCGLAPCNGLTNVRRGHDLTPDKQRRLGRHGQVVAGLAGRHPRRLLPRDLGNPAASLAGRPGHELGQPQRHPAGRAGAGGGQHAQLAEHRHLSNGLCRQHQDRRPEPVQGRRRGQRRFGPEHPPQHAAGQYSGDRQHQQPAGPGPGSWPVAGAYGGHRRGL